MTSPENDEDRRTQIDELDAISACLGETRIRWSKPSASEKNFEITGSVDVYLEPLDEPVEFVSGRQRAHLRHLPPVTLKFQLPLDYPTKSSPRIEPTCLAMTQDQLAALRVPIDSQLSDLAGMMALFTVASTVGDSVRAMFAEIRRVDVDALCQEGEPPSDRWRSLTAAADLVARADFERDIYDCAVCFEQQSGANCCRFEPCAHIFCLTCCRSYFVEKTQSQAVEALHCLAPSCSSPAAEPLARRLLGDEEFERYERLLIDRAIASMSDVMYCPRKKCQQPILFEPERNAKLGTCSSCKRSFCVMCRSTYHGTQQPCNFPKQDMDRIRAEWEKADGRTRQKMATRFGGVEKLQRLLDEYSTQAYIGNHTKPCPKCKSPIEKRDGCNKMQCSKCSSYFCWLCCRVIDLEDPYAHYRADGPCENMLFEGVEIDSDDDFEEDDFEDDDDEDDYTAEEFSDDDDEENEEGGQADNRGRDRGRRRARVNLNALRLDDDWNVMG